MWSILGLLGLLANFYKINLIVLCNCILFYEEDAKVE